jgi:hypothetical protein
MKPRIVIYFMVLSLALISCDSFSMIRGTIYESNVNNIVEAKEDDMPAECVDSKRVQFAKISLLRGDGTIRRTCESNIKGEFDTHVMLGWIKDEMHNLIITKEGYEDYQISVLFRRGDIQQYIVFIKKK